MVELKKQKRRKEYEKKLNLCPEMRARIALETEAPPGLNVSAMSVTI